MRSTSAITVVTKSYMKPWHGATIIFHFSVVEKEIAHKEGIR